MLTGPEAEGNKGSFGNYKVSKNAPDINKGGNFGPV
jgi:hypothetical protein